MRAAKELFLKMKCFLSNLWSHLCVHDQSLSHVWLCVTLRTAARHAPLSMGWASLVAQRVKPLPAMWETRVWSLGWEGPLEKEMATHSSTLAWKIPWFEKPGRLQSTGSQRVRHDWATSLHLVAKWVRICLPMQGTWVSSLSTKIPRPTTPVCHSYRACTLEPLTHTTEPAL